MIGPLLSFRGGLQLPCINLSPCLRPCVEYVFVFCTFTSIGCDSRIVILVQLNEQELQRINQCAHLSAVLRWLTSQGSRPELRTGIRPVDQLCSHRVLETGSLDCSKRAHYAHVQTAQCSYFRNITDSLIDKTRLKNADFRSILAVSASAVTPSEKVQLTLIGSPLRAFQWAQDEHHNIITPLIPKGWLKNAKCPKFEQ